MQILKMFDYNLETNTFTYVLNSLKY
jgi:hypothetical protein